MEILLIAASIVLVLIVRAVREPEDGRAVRVEIPADERRKRRR